MLSIAINVPLAVYASDNMNSENVLKADFDTNFLVGNAQKLILVDLNTVTLFYLANIVLMYILMDNGSVNESFSLRP